MEKHWNIITDRFCYRFLERVTTGLLKNPELKIVRLTVHGHEIESSEIELCTTELKVFIPIFIRFLELKDVRQNYRKRKMKEFIQAIKIKEL